jgi:DNA mismatch repair protein MutS2
MDQQTKEWLQWSSIWEQIKPLSLYGLEVKRNLIPYTKGQEEEWLEEIKQTRQLEFLLKRKQGSIEELAKTGEAAKRYNKARMDIEDAFRVIQDPRPFLQLLKRGETGSEADWFHLKQFLWNTQLLFRNLFTVSPSIEQALAMVQNLLDKLQAGQQSFSLEEGNLNLISLRQKKAEIIQEQIQVRDRQRRQIEEDLQTRIMGNQQFFISSKDIFLLEKCLAHEGVEKVRETPFEIIFTIIRSKEESDLLQLSDSVDIQIDQEEYEKLEELRTFFLPFITDIAQWTEWIGLWDWRWAKVKWLQSEERCWPVRVEKSVQVNVIKGRYLPLSQPLSAVGKEYTPLSITCRSGLTTIVGSNMGGKSIAVKTLGLLVALAHYGLPLPARSFKTTLFQRMIAISGDNQNVQEGVSTFGAEMVRLSSCIEGKDQLLFLDELARGTNPTEGEALALAIGKALAVKEEQMAVMITHFSILASIDSAKHYRVIGLEESEGAATTSDMNYQLVENNQQEVPHHALLIARRLGLPTSIIEEAERQIREGEKHGKATIKSREN